jgi:hypothetical protein
MTTPTKDRSWLPSERMRHKNTPAPPPQPEQRPEPEILNLTQIEEMKLVQPKHAIQGLVTTPGAWLVLGAMKAGKTILSMQMALDYHAGNDFLGHYKMLESRAALVIEQDDPAGLASIQAILRVYPGLRRPADFNAVAKPDFVLGEGFTEWLEKQIRQREVGLVVLDSYTKMRARRQPGGDIVKQESDDFTLLNTLAQRTGCLILILHHPSKGSVSLDWDQQGAGTFAIGAAVDGLMKITRFRDLPVKAPERLVQVRGRHIQGAEMLVRFKEETLSYDLLLEGSAAQFYPEIQSLKRHFTSRTFAPKDVVNETGMGRSTVHRVIDRLLYGNVLTRRGYGEYALTEGLEI